MAGVAWRGVAWRGVAWRGVAWRGVAWRGVARLGVALHGVVWRGVESSRRGALQNYHDITRIIMMIRSRQTKRHTSNVQTQTPQNQRLSPPS